MSIVKEQISCTIPQTSSNNWPRAGLGYPMNPCPSEMKDMNSFSKPSMMSHNGLNQMASSMPTMGSQQGSFMQQGMGGHLMNNNQMGMMNSSSPSWGMSANSTSQRPSYPFMSPMAPPTPQGQQFQQQRQNYYDDMPLYVENPQMPQNQYQMTPNETFARVNSNPNPCNNSNCLRCKKPTNN
ncbi:unnamed protein product [Diamesa tonsa]